MTYQVRWVPGGGRAEGGRSEESESFTSEARALLFKEDVERAGHRWPTNARGLQWVKGEGYLEPDVAPVPVITFAEVAESYLQYQQKMMKLGHLKPYTLYRYRRSYVLHLSTDFGNMPFTDITPLDIEDWMVSQLDLPSSGKSVRNRHGLLSSIMTHGKARMGLRGDNPCETSRLPSKDGELGRQLRFFDHGEWGLFRACLKADVHLLVDVALETGMRWGELSALRVGDLTFPDDETTRIHIVRAWSKRAPDDPSKIKTSEGENASWKLGPPKSKRSRHVVLQGESAVRLRQATGSHAPGTYVFRTRRGTPWRYPDFHSDRWTPARVDAEARGLSKHATPHMLRHTAVVWSLARGVRIEVVSEMLGHASIQVTYDIYGGLINLHDPQMAQAMAQEMLMVRQAIVPAPPPDEVEARKIRPGSRGVSRRRVG